MLLIRIRPLPGLNVAFAIAVLRFPLTSKILELGFDMLFTAYVPSDFFRKLAHREVRTF